MFISKACFLYALEHLNAVHPFFGITYLSAKKNGLPVGTKTEYAMDAKTRELMDDLQRLHPDSENYFQPFKSNDREKLWVEKKYPSSGLQAINTQTFRGAFLHTRKEKSWGWSNDYIDFLKLALDQSSISLPAFALAVWSLRKIDLPEDTSATDIIERFFADYHILEAEKTRLFTVTVPADVPGNLLSTAPLTWEDLSDSLSLPPDKAPAEDHGRRLITSAQKRYWLFSAGDNSSRWEEFFAEGIMAIGWEEMGDLTVYESKETMKAKMKQLYGEEYTYRDSALATWQFAGEIRPGDIVFVKKGRQKIIGRGIVESDYKFDTTRTEYNNVRIVLWTHKGEWEHPGFAVMKALTEITAYTEYIDKLESLLLEEDVDTSTVEELAVDYPPYTREDFLHDVFITPAQYDRLVSSLKYQKNIILQGPPGVGKTFVARRLAYSIMGFENQRRVMMVQFHQSYSYEDFILGYRPAKEGFELTSGPFYEFCKDAQDDDENNYFFIIDEINRGNMSKIFGELLMLIERDKRGENLRLIYSNELFSVPANVHIIGMMNTADRSLAMIDYALRRRFAFFEMSPAFDSNGFAKVITLAANPKFTALTGVVKGLNDAIVSDEALGRGFCIGHSYLCTDVPATDEWLSHVVELEIIPLINEYWFDETEKVDLWSEKLRGALK